MEIVKGNIIQMQPEGITVFVPYVNWDRACLRQYSEVQIGLPDGRTISPEQRRKAHALLGEIAAWVGDTPEFIKRLMKLEFIHKRLQALEKELFSLSSCDVTTAREFITFLIDFMVEHDVPSKTPLQELCEDAQKYVYACLMHKKCAVCGKTKADLHHFDQIGMGNDRTKIYQIGMRVISLCRICHGEAHSKGKTIITDDWHLTPIPLTKEIGKIYRLSRKNLEDKTDEQHNDHRQPDTRPGA